MMRCHRGVTLLELLLTLVVLGAITSITTLTARRIQKPPVVDPSGVVTESLQVAIAEGRAISFEVVIRGKLATATVYPGGSVIADTALHVDGLTGRPTDAR